MKLPNISIDKLSFTARLDDKCDSMVQYLSKIPYDLEYKNMNWNFIYQHQFLFKGAGLFIQMGHFEGQEVFRMEFNPNKITKEYLTFYFNILKRIKYPNVTRIDWAVDYEEDFTKYDIRQLSSRKTIEYKSRTGVLETLYIGSMKSDKFTRIYNKALEKRKARMKIVDEDEEIKVKETLWRVESVMKDFEIEIEEEVTSYVEHLEGSFVHEVPKKWFISGQDLTGRTVSKEYDLKPDKKRIEGAVEVTKTEKVGYDYIFQNPFSNIEIYKKYEGGNDLKISEKAMLFFLESNPDEWANLSPKTKTKYEELKYSYSWVLIPNQPSQIFEKEKNRLADELESWLKPALDKSEYLTGYKSNLYFSLLFLKQQAEKEDK